MALKKKELHLVAKRLDVENEFRIDGTKVTATAAELNALDGITSSVVALNALNGAPLGASFVVGAEAANVINVAVQLEDADGVALATRAAVHWYLSADANGDTLAAAPSGGIAIGTNGLAMEYVANQAGIAISEADGTIDFNITEAATPTMHLVVVLANGLLAVSGAITFA